MDGATDAGQTIPGDQHNSAKLGTLEPLSVGWIFGINFGAETSLIIGYRIGSSFPFSLEIDPSPLKTSPPTYGGALCRALERSYVVQW
jgi:hypothetical protein